MSATRAFNLQVPSKFDNFKSKFPQPQPASSAPSNPVHDTLLSEMAIDSRNSVSSGLHHTIDFQGDQRPLFMALCFYAASFYDSLDLKQHSKVSPPTLVAYFQFIIFAYYLISDMDIRSTPSQHTRFMHTPEYIDLKAFLLSLPVPTILLKFLQACAPTADPRRPNINFVPSFASFNNSIDFGRYFPINILLHSHNFVISNKTNDAPEDLIRKLLNITVDTDNTKIANYFGQLLQDGDNSDSYAHQLMQAFEGIINPALARSRSQRNVYSRINVHNVSLFIDFNPYIFHMMIDEDNVSECMTLMRQLSTCVSAKLPTSGSLAQVMSTLTGTNILVHGYSSFAVPTWHYGAVKIADATNVNNSVTGKIYASKLKFLGPKAAGTATTVKYPDAADIDAPLYLVEPNAGGAKFPADSDYVTVKARTDTVPPVRILDPYDYNAATFHNVFLSGSIIESREIDGSAVPHPNEELVLDEENSLFLQSAVAFSNVLPGIRYDRTTHVTAERRFQPGESGQPATTLLYDVSRSRLPIMRRTVSGTIPASIPGFQLQHHVYHWNAAYNRLAFRVPTTDDKKNNVPPIDTSERLIVWSPYRYFNGKVIATNALQNYFMLTNLRTIFGTNPPLGEVSHFLEVMPVS